MEENFMVTFIVFALATLINVILATLKNVITVKGGRVIASVSNAVAYGFNTIIIKSIANVELWIAVLISVVANLLGVYIALTLIHKFEKERLWKITVTVPTESLHSFKQELKNEDIPFIAYETSYEKYKVVDIFSKTKKDSKKIKTLMSNYNVKYTISVNTVTL